MMRNSRLLLVVAAAVAPFLAGSVAIANANGPLDSAQIPIHEILDAQVPLKDRLARLANLGPVTNPKVSDALVTIMKDRQQPDELRRATAELLDRSSYTALTGDLVEILRDHGNGDSAFRVYCIQTLFTKMEWTIEGRGKADMIVQSFRRCLFDPNQKSREAAMGHLIARRDAVAIKAAWEAFNHPDQSLFSKAEAIRFLSISGEAEAPARFTPLLKQAANSEIRIAAIQALANDPTSRKDVIGVLANSQEQIHVRYAALDALFRGQDRNISDILSLLSDATEDICFRALSIRRLGDFAGWGVMTEDEMEAVQQTLVRVSSEKNKVVSDAAKEVLSKIAEEKK